MSLNGSVYVGTFAGGAWQAPSPMRGIFFPPNQTPALAASGDGMFHLFVHDGAGQVWYNRNTNGTWATWQNLGGNVTGNLTAASSYLNSADVFAMTPDHKLARNTWTATPNGSGFSGWSAEFASDTNVGSSPTAISTGVKSLDVFYYDATKTTMLWRRHLDGTVANPAWTKENLGEIFALTPIGLSS